MPRQYLLSSSQVAKAVAAYSRGESIAVMSLAYNVSPQTLRRAIYRAIREQPEKSSRALKPCGTNAAYERHRRNGEVADDACLAAHRAARLVWIANDPGHKEKRKRWNAKRYQKPQEASQG